MSYFTTMAKPADKGKVKRFEWLINDCGEVVVFYIEEDGKRGMFAAEEVDGLVIGLFGQIGRIEPDLFDCKSWQEVADTLNHNKGVARIKARARLTLLSRLGMYDLVPVGYDYDTDSYRVKSSE